MKFVRVISLFVILLIAMGAGTAQSVMANDDVVRAATVCDVEDGPLSFESEHFYINYDTIEGGLSVQEYANALEETYNIEVNSYGWAAPPLCTAAACGGRNANPWGKYPVQIAGGIGEELLGYVTGGGSYAGYYIGDNPNTAAVESFSTSTCMVLNNDFSPFGDDPSEVLRETVAHEFLHAIQEGYGDNSDALESNMWYESSAVYIEDEVVDQSISDNFYLWPQVDNCLADWPNQAAPERLSEYSNFLLFRYAAEQTGGTHLAGGGEDVIQAMWQNIGLEQTAITAFDNALRTRGQRLPALFHTYATAMKFSRSCGEGYVAPYCFAEGDEYRASTSSSPQSHGSLVAANVLSFSGNIKDDYAVNWIDLPANSRFDLTMQNSSNGGTFQASFACDSGTQIRVSPLSPAPIGAGGMAQLSAVDTNGCVDATLVITNQARSENANICTARSYTVTRSDPTQPAPEPEPEPNLDPVQLYLPLIAVLN